MKSYIKLFNKILIVIILISLPSCREELRGDIEKSNDGKTYLVFENGCDTLYVNSIFWPHAIGAKGQVKAGTCEISCDAYKKDISINIDEGTIFHFDYWGP